MEEIDRWLNKTGMPEIVSVKGAKRYGMNIKEGKLSKDDIFVFDILREEMANDDPRIQRIISE